MDEQLANLKPGLAEARKTLRLGQHDRLMRSLDAAADAYAKADAAAATAKSTAARADAEKARAESAVEALVAVMDLLRDERLEAPFRFLFDMLENSRRRARTKPLDDALHGARLAAAVDDLMERERISLDEACRKVAKDAGYSAKYRRKGNILNPAAQLRELRDSIKQGRARDEALELYKLLRQPDQAWAPDDERPAPYLKRPRRGKRKPEPKPF